MDELVVMRCKYCKSIATSELKWVRVIGKNEEVLHCSCGQNEFEFVKLDRAAMKPEYLVMKG